MDRIRRRLRDLTEGYLIAQRALLANKTRAALTTLGIVIGVVTVTLMVMIIQGLNASFAQQISFLGANTVYVNRYPWVWDEDWWKYINRPRITLDHYEAVKERSDLAMAVAPQLWTGRPVMYRGTALDQVSILGTTYDYGLISSAVPEAGRFINEIDVRQVRHSAVIGQDVRDELFRGLNPMGRDIRVGAHNFTVVGVLEKQGSTFGQSRDNIIIIPYSTLINDWGRNRSVTIAVRGAEGVQTNELKDELTGIMRSARNLKPRDEANFSINEQAALQSFYDAMTSGVYAAGLIIGGISLLVGGIGIMNIMLVSVTERTWEIGMRKAVGARTSHILWQFLVEAMLICSFGGVLGLGLAWLGSLAVREAMPAVLPAWLAFASVAFSASIGLVFGLFPAAKASRLDPIEALRAK